MPIRVLRRCALLLAWGVVAISAIRPGAAFAEAEGLTVAHVYTGWREAASFKRISEYFDGKENTGGQQVVRTHPGQRTGFYFLARIINAGGAQPVKISLEIILPIGEKLRTFTFAADLNAGTNVLNLGLTGPDWPDSRANPVAWRMNVLSADGRVLVTEKSYLWEEPPDS